jgi:hypothetical protein
MWYDASRGGKVGQAAQEQAGSTDMLRWIVVSVLTAGMLGPTEPEPATRPKQAESEPTSRPAGAASTLRRPAQSEILRNLLSRQDRPTPILPRADALQPPAVAGLGPDGRPLLVEGTAIVERPGRLVREGGRAKFVFYLDGDSQAPRAMPVLESQLLETLENEVQAGFDEFIVSGEVTRYRGTNYLLLRKVLRRTGQGNLQP